MLNKRGFMEKELLVKEARVRPISAAEDIESQARRLKDGSLFSPNPAFYKGISQVFQSRQNPA